ncbi:acyclic terpene utilization AtuA family protein [Erythrobacter sp. AP23]|uniref:acyclic terpene utilization AtuA family protein n=1 Tax=Erythrobacter sp. AP23 TaxID=499656 RepID=UPI00076C2515|nr:acyclic terpene utilization AtuA family protein [Erythrobacter sp. AP23]KWV93791.1 hypothetical protein ASS64_12920 [Erythrobacter sp. AP23]
MQQALKIGGGGAFWGDSMIGFDQLLNEDLDYIVLDYLAEVTMSVLARAKQKNPELGYATDFVDRLLPDRLGAIARRGVKVITNAGGLNPEAAASRIARLIADRGLALTVTAVGGDDLSGRAEEFRSAGVADMYSNAPFPEDSLSINAYLGAFPLVEALQNGADIVVTGRCVDSAMALAPCIHHFSWRRSDYDRLAAGSLAGHILECGAQATGGIFTDWEESHSWDRIGYPIASIQSDGTIEISKPRDTGGLVSRGTVSEQILYEVGNPAAYHLPDVICDFSNVEVEQISGDLVRVSGASGAPPSGNYKVSVTYADGFRTAFYLSVVGIGSRRKAERVASSLRDRSRRLFSDAGLSDFAEFDFELFGESDCETPTCTTTILKLAARHEDARALEVFTREAVSAGTSMAPGICGVGGGRPRVSPCVRLFSCLLPKGVLEGARLASPSSSPEASHRHRAFPGSNANVATAGRPEEGPPRPTAPLVDFAWARSGDKGDTANIGVIARKPEYVDHLRKHLTIELVRDCLGDAVHGRITRFEAPGLHAFNFVLESALGGGGMASLRNDPQGKGFAQRLLAWRIPSP